MFIDEAWIARNVARTHGRWARGERLRRGFPHGHRKTMTLVAGRIVAPMVLDGPINGDWFEACVRQVLAPTPQGRRAHRRGSLDRQRLMRGGDGRADGKADPGARGA